MMKTEGDNMDRWYQNKHHNLTLKQKILNSTKTTLQHEHKRKRKQLYYTQDFKFTTKISCF